MENCDPALLKWALVFNHRGRVASINSDDSAGVVLRTFNTLDLSELEVVSTIGAIATAALERRNVLRRQS